jgi:hypothetical protein
VLTDVHVDWEGLDVVDVHPDVPGDVWAEKPLVVHGRYRTPGEGRLVLTGFQQGRPYRQEVPVVLPAQQAGDEPIASMWARAKVEALTTEDLGGLQTGTFPAPLRAQIEAVALAHRLVTPFTSFVAVEERVVNEGGTQRTVRVPVEIPDGVRYEGIFGTGATPGAEAMARGVAGGAQMSMRFAAQEATSAARPAAALAADRAYVSPVVLGDRARQRLGSSLRVLLEEGADARGAAVSADGWVAVDVTLADPSAAALRALQEAGFVIERIDGPRVRGVVALDALVALAELPAVTWIEAREA